MTLSATMSSRPGAGYRAMRVALWTAVILQGLVCLFMALGYAAILSDPTDESHFVRQALKFPMSAKLTAALLTVGLIVTAASGVGMLRRAKWAPFPYIIWVCVAATENIFHSVDLLRFPFLGFPLSICLLYCWALKVETRAAEEAPVSLNYRERLHFARAAGGRASVGADHGSALTTGAPDNRLWWRLLLLLSLLGLLPPVGAAVSPFTFFAGVFGGGPGGRTVVGVSLLGFALSAACFAILVQSTFGN